LWVAAFVHNEWDVVFYGLVSDFNTRRNRIDDHQILSESLRDGSVVQQFEKFTSLLLWCSLGGFMGVCHQSILIISRAIPPQICGELTESRKDCFPSRRGKLLEEVSAWVSRLQAESKSPSILSEIVRFIAKRRREIA
jgi:hypothetical protein